MGNLKNSPAAMLPDWWQREKQKRMIRFLIFLVLVLILIAYFYYMSAMGITGFVPGITFDTTNRIVFVRQDDKGNTGIYCVRADGTDLRSLTDPSDKSSKASPQFTMDGKNVVYASNLREASSVQIYILGAGEPRQLTVGAGSKSSPTVSPDGKTIAFIASGAIKTVNLNGADLYQVMPQPRAGNAPVDPDKGGGIDAVDLLLGPFLSAAFSSDGSGIAGAQDATGDMDAGAPSQLVGDQVVMAIPPGGTRAVPLDQGHEVCLSWEPNGKRLACGFTELETRTGQKDGKKQIVSGIRIWSFDQPTAPSAKPVFAGLGYSVEPKNIAWSPDGTKMAIEAWRLKPDGSRLPAGIIVLDMSEVKSSPAGAQISEDNVDAVRYMVAATADGAPQNPHWSPDGTRLLYELAHSNGKRDLCLINTDGTNAVNLTHGVDDNSQAAWSPLRRNGD